MSYIMLMVLLIRIKYTAITSGALLSVNLMVPYKDKLALHLTSWWTKID